MTNHCIDLDAAFQALSDPTRRAIVRSLAARPASVSELLVPFEMAKPTMLQHVRVLEKSGFVATEKIGRVRMCFLRAEALEAAMSWLDAQKSIWEARADRFDAYVLTLEAEESTK